MIHPLTKLFLPFLSLFWVIAGKDILKKALGFLLPGSKVPGPLGGPFPEPNRLFHRKKLLKHLLPFGGIQPEEASKFSLREKDNFRKLLPGKPQEFPNDTVGFAGLATEGLPSLFFIPEKEEGCFIHRGGAGAPCFGPFLLGMAFYPIPGRAQGKIEPDPAIIGKGRKIALDTTVQARSAPGKLPIEGKTEGIEDGTFPCPGLTADKENVL